MYLILLNDMGGIDGVSMDPVKIEAVMRWERPKNVAKIRSFLGLVGYYWRFLEGFSKLAAPLTYLTHKDVKFIWNRKCEESFQESKTCLALVHVFTIPSGNEIFVTYSDVSYTSWVMC